MLEVDCYTWVPFISSENKKNSNVAVRLSVRPLTTTQQQQQQQQQQQLI